MGKLKRFEITFKNKNGICYSGSPLKGALVMELGSKFKVKEIRLRFHGYAMVHWTERHSTGTGKNKRQVTKHFSGEELYFDHTVVIFGSRNEECETFESGIHKFPFEFYVPDACPTSYEGSWGRVRYYVLATLEKMWAVNTFVAKGFSVVNQFDLNQDTRSQECVGAENEMTLCCMCCKSGPIIAQLTLDSIGFVPGEGIPIRAEIINHSSRRIAGVSATLQMVVKYNAVKKSKTHCNVVASISKNDLQSRDKSVIWSGDKLVVPAVPPSFVTGCGIIDISYILELTVNPSGPSFNLPVKIEVLIGTVPLKSPFRNTSYPSVEGPSVVSVSKIRPSSLSNNDIKIDDNKEEDGDILNDIVDDMSSSRLTQSSQHGQESLLDTTPALTFMESILGSVSLEGDFDKEKLRGTVTFTPVYPYYGSPNPEASFDAGMKKNDKR